MAARDNTRGRERGRDLDDDRGSDREERSGRGGSESRKGGGFSYRGRSSEDVTRRAKQSSGRYDSFLTEEVTWYKPHDGENQIRVMPWLNGDDPDFDALAEKWGTHWGIDIIVHRNVGPDNGTYLCLDKMNGDPCPPCDAYRDGEDDLRGSDRVLCWLIDRKNEKAGPQLWAMPLGTSKDISAVSQVKGSGAVLLIDDPAEGYDIYFDREGEKKRTTYKRVEVARDPSPLHENEKKENVWLDYISEHRLPDLLRFYDADYLDKVLSGQSSKREDSDGDSERGTRFGSDGGGTERPSRRGRGSEDSSRGLDRDDDAAAADGEFTRSSRRGRGRGAEEPEDEVEDAPGERDRDRSERGSGRSSRRGDPAPEERSGRARRSGDSSREEPDDPDPGDDRGGRSRGGRTERYRSDDKGVPVADKDDDKIEARERLGRVGRRGRK